MIGITSQIPLEELAERPYSQLLCYPMPSEEEVARRIEELRSLGVKALLLKGRVKLGNLQLLGKGGVSLVVGALVEGDEVLALKIRRVDAVRPSLEGEASLLRIANELGIGPRLRAHSKNFLLLEEVKGSSIDDWVRSLKGKGKKVRLRLVVKELLEQCRRMDARGLDHGELSQLRKHVMVEETPGEKPKVIILDYESASLNRRCNNTTSAAQYLFLGGPIAKRVKGILGLKEGERQYILGALHEYKSRPCDEAFMNLLTVLRLAS